MAVKDDPGVGVFQLGYVCLPSMLALPQLDRHAVEILAAVTGAHVLLKTVVRCVQADMQAVGARGELALGDLDRHKLERILASVTFAGCADRDDH